MTTTSATKTGKLCNNNNNNNNSSSNNNLLMQALILVTVLATANSAEAEVTMEAAFQGHCGHTSPCEQLCYEIHDGMYECDCIEGYELNKNGYSCQVINSTSSNNDGHSKSDEDVLYQKGASFSAKLANDSERDSKLTATYAASAPSAAAAAAESALSASASATASVSASMSPLFADEAERSKYDFTYIDYDVNEFGRQQNEQNVNFNDYYISPESINFNSEQSQDQNNRNINNNKNNNDNNNNDYNYNYDELSKDYEMYLAFRHQLYKPQRLKHTKVIITKKTMPTTSPAAATGTTTTAATTAKATATTTTTLRTTTTNNYENKKEKAIQETEEDYYNYKSDRISSNDDDDNVNEQQQQQLNIRPITNYPNTYQTHKVQKQKQKISLVNNKKQSNIIKLKNNTNNINHKNVATLKLATATAATTTATTTTIENINISNESNITLHDAANSASLSHCNLDCGTEGICDNSEAIDGVHMRCLCPFGKTGPGCMEAVKARIPKFSQKSWIAFPALHGAYKHVQLRIEFRPESFDGIILLSGERDDLTGDFMALLLNKGFVEFWFDCGSGVGSVRSRETILLNEWNSVIIYRHRWDAWLVLNHGTKVQGRSNGLFSRITFREPVFLGGTGNITGLAKRLPVYNGFVGCIRRFVANEHDYKFDEHPLGDVIKGFDIQDCITDKCIKYPCQHGGKCLPSDQGAVCLCPIGFVGDLCEIRMDLQVPAFNGSSFLRYAPLGDSALIWLELKVILKPEQSDGLILYSGPEKQGDFIALYLHHGFVEFAFDLGSGPAVVRSEHALTVGQWHTIRISRTARLAVLKIDQHQEVMTISTNGFWHLSLAENFFVGGVSHMDRLPMDLKYRPFFVGCIQRIDINGHSLGIVSEALGGSNIGNCPHACVARPCGPLAECVPQMESYECRCSTTYNQRSCNKAAEVTPEELQLHKASNSNSNNNQNNNNKNNSKHKTNNRRIDNSNNNSNNNNDNNNGVVHVDKNDDDNDIDIKQQLEQQQQNSRILETVYNADVSVSASSATPLYETKGLKKMRAHKKHLTKKHRYLHKMAQTTSTTTTTQPTTTTTTTTIPTTTTPITMATRSTSGITMAMDNEEIEDDIIYSDAHRIEMQQQQPQPFNANNDDDDENIEREHNLNKQHMNGGKHAHQHAKQQHHGTSKFHRIKDETIKHKPSTTFGHKLSKLPTHYESFQTNPDSDILTFDDNVDWIAQLQQEEKNDEAAAAGEAAYEQLSEEQEYIDTAWMHKPQTVKSEQPSELIENRNSETPDTFVFDESLFDATDGTEEYQRKQLAQDMQRIMSNKPTNKMTTTTTTTTTIVRTPDDDAEYDYSSHEDTIAAAADANDDVANVDADADDVIDADDDDDLLTPFIEQSSNKQDTPVPPPPATHLVSSTTPTTHTDWSLLKKFDLSVEHQSKIGLVRKNFGACFAGVDSYFHYNDAETMSQIISYNIDLNLRIKTHSQNGVILWTGRQDVGSESAEQHNDYLSLGIEDGYLHFRYDLGSGAVDIRFNATRVSDGLWHRVRAIRNAQAGYLEVDGRKTATLQAPGKLRQLNTDTGLYVGGMTDASYFTRRKYANGIVGCISEIVLAGELKLNFDPNTLGTSHNVETGLL